MMEIEQIKVIFWLNQREQRNDVEFAQQTPYFYIGGVVWITGGLDDNPQCYCLYRVVV